MNFNNLKYLLDAKLLCANGDFDALSELQNGNGGGRALSRTFEVGSESLARVVQPSYAAPSKGGSKNVVVGGANVMSFDE